MPLMGLCNDSCQHSCLCNDVTLRTARLVYTHTFDRNIKDALKVHNTGLKESPPYDTQCYHVEKQESNPDIHNECIHICLELVQANAQVSHVYNLNPTHSL